MATWGEFAAARHDLAHAGRALLYQVGVGLAFLSTVRKDGGPRVHPMCPLLTDDGLYAFIIPSPKQTDLTRDGRYAMHSFPTDSNEDAFYVAGTASQVEDSELRERLAEQFVAERTAVGVPTPEAHDVLFAFDIERVLLTRTTGHGDMEPQHTVWAANGYSNEA